MKPFGKWLADFELPPEDEPEPQIEVVINQGGELPDWTHAQVIQWSPAFGAWENPAAVAAEDILRRAFQVPCKFQFTDAAHICGKTPTFIIADDFEQGDRHG